AREFLDTKYTIVVLEAGGLHYEVRSQDPYRSEVVGLPHTGVHCGRVRVFGGTTTLWAGQALPLSPIDFEVRDWVPHSGWPVSFSALRSYYRRAEEVMKLRPSSYDKDACLIRAARIRAWISNSSTVAYPSSAIIRILPLPRFL